MKINDIPQDNSRIFNGQRKVIYATDNGQYSVGKSNGWQDEEFATTQAVNELNEQTEIALQEVKKGNKSIIYYLMYLNRYDEVSLAQATGFWKWQIKRHFTPRIFAKLTDKQKAIYCEVFGIKNLG